jgi:hypothetical protein
MLVSGRTFSNQHECHNRAPVAERTAFRPALEIDPRAELLCGNAVSVSPLHLPPV